jgi:hypothetical protein
MNREKLKAAQPNLAAGGISLELECEYWSFLRGK